MTLLWKRDKGLKMRIEDIVTFKKDLLVVLDNGIQPLTTFTKESSIPYVAGVLDPSLQRWLDVFKKIY